MQRKIRNIILYFTCYFYEPVSENLNLIIPDKNWFDQYQNMKKLDFVILKRAKAKAFDYPYSKYKNKFLSILNDVETNQFKIKSPDKSGHSIIIHY